MAVVYTGGTFDILHFGHVHFLQECSLLGDLVVALNKDEFIEEFKGRPPVFSYQERKEALEYLGYEVVPNIDGADSKPTILKVAPKYLAIASDWARKNYYKQMGFTQDWLDDQDITLVYIPYTRQVSTTLIRERLAG